MERLNHVPKIIQVVRDTSQVVNPNHYTEPLLKSNCPLVRQ